MGQKVNPTVSALDHDGLEVALVQGARLQDLVIEDWKIRDYSPSSSRVPR